ncbi:MAG: 1,4-dihydroxy-2-naphthoate polyprenyltransferase [Deltaproteobacteria bacterium]|nr:1,4-dihydroxy-2-naphthoate polyprenyltransferase [Deltaproteobacteria bacterium]
MSESALKNWALAARPKTLWAAVSPVIIGTAMAFEAGRGHWLSAVMAGIGAILIQIGTNFANDYFDYLHGADKGERLGPVRLTQAGLVKPAAMKTAFIVAFALAFLVGVYLVWRGGWPIVVIGVLSIMFGIAYTGGPFPLGYHGLGDVFVFIFFGLVAVGGTYYVQALQLDGIVLLAGVAPGLFSTAILTVNNYRDIDTDRQAGKRTLAVRFGPAFARMEYLISLLGACLVPVVLCLRSGGHVYALAATLVFLAAIPSLKIVFREKPGRVFNEVLAGTGKLLLLYSIIFSIGWMI